MAIAPAPSDIVKARILPMGAGKVFTGELVQSGKTPEEKFPTHPKGAVVDLPRAIAETQEALGRVEIQ